MVFISGPRQCGKTTLAKEVLERAGQGLYLNWDDSIHRRRILSRDWDDSARLIVFDELHKFPRWKRWLKGLWDTTLERHRYLVTGSARLDVYRRGGDSLLGRYHHWRLHPFCLAERPPGFSVDEAFRRLMSVGGFPEPFLADDPREAARWRAERRERVIKEDLRDLERIRELTLVSLLVDLLSTRVGGEVVASNLAGDLDVAPKTVQYWIEMLERMYVGFVVRPYSGKLARSIRKVPKFYFYDIGDVEGDEGARFENLVAHHLLKRIHFLADYAGEKIELHYLRDKEGHEVDFLLTRKRVPSCLIEAKLTDAQPDSDLSYFGERLGVSRRIQLVARLDGPSTKAGVDIIPAKQWLSRELDSDVFGV